MDRQAHPTTEERRRPSHIWRWLALSAALHLPFSPLVPLLGLAGVLLGRTPVPDEPKETLVGIPVELLGEEQPPAVVPPETTPAAVSQPSDPVIVPTPKPRPRPLELDGGLSASKGPDGGLDAGLDGGKGDAGTEDGGTQGDGGTEDGGAQTDGGTEDGGGPADAGMDASVIATVDAGAASADPLRITGNFAKVAQSNANIRIHFFVTQLRQHPAGSVINELLESEPQWRDLLAPTGINPLRDLDKLFLYGPQLRHSDQIGVFLQFGKDVTELRAKVDAIVQRSGKAGEWSREGGKPVGRGTAAGAPRAFVLYPGQIVGMVPEAEVGNAVSISRLSLPEPTHPGEIVTVSAKDPYRIAHLRSMGLSVPESIKQVRLTVLGTADGGALVKLVAGDESPESAQVHAEEMLRQLRALTGGLLSVSLESRGKEILGETRVRPLQLAFMLNEVRNYVERWRQGGATRKSRKPDKKAAEPRAVPSSYGTSSHRTSSVGK